MRSNPKSSDNHVLLQIVELWKNPPLIRRLRHCSRTVRVWILLIITNIKIYVNAVAGAACAVSPKKFLHAKGAPEFEPAKLPVASPQHHSGTLEGAGGRSEPLLMRWLTRRAALRRV